MKIGTIIYNDNAFNGLGIVISLKKARKLCGYYKRSQCVNCKKDREYTGIYFFKPTVQNCYAYSKGFHFQWKEES